MTNQKLLLKVTSVLTAFLFSIHVVQDYVRGVDKLGPLSVIGVAILVVWLLGALVWADRRAGQVIVLLAGFLAAGVTVLHFNSTRIGELWKSDGAFAYIWVLIAGGAIGAVSFVLAVRALMTRQSSSA